MKKICMKVIKDDIAFIEHATLDQSDSVAWRQVRTGRITASIAFDVLHTNQERPSKSLILKICLPASLSQCPQLFGGKRMTKMP